MHEVRLPLMMLHTNYCSVFFNCVLVFRSVCGTNFKRVNSNGQKEAPCPYVIHVNHVMNFNKPTRGPFRANTQPIFERK